MEVILSNTKWMRDKVRETFCVSLSASKAVCNRARDADTGEVREANELAQSGQARPRGWVCRNDRCRIELRLCCGDPSSRKGKDKGKPFERPPYFRRLAEHVPDCWAMLEDGREGTSGEATENEPSYPLEYPEKVTFTRPVRGRARTGKLEAVDEGWLSAVEAFRPAERKLRSLSRDTIRDACRHYIESADNHQHALVVEDCDGTTYAECFVLVGTGGSELVGSRRVFYAQVRFTALIDYSAEPLVIPLFSTLSGAPRRLVVETAEWSEEEQRDFRADLRKAVAKAKAAFYQRQPQRPWVFFVSTEWYLDQDAFYADLYPGLDTFVCDMPKQQRAFRSSFFRAPESPHSDPRRDWGADGWTDTFSSQAGSSDERAPVSMGAQEGTGGATPTARDNSALDSGDSHGKQDLGGRAASTPRASAAEPASGDSPHSSFSGGISETVPPVGGQTLSEDGGSAPEERGGDEDGGPSPEARSRSARGIGHLSSHNIWSGGDEAERHDPGCTPPPFVGPTPTSMPLPSGEEVGKGSGAAPDGRSRQSRRTGRQRRFSMAVKDVAVRAQRLVQAVRGLRPRWPWRN